MNKKINEMFKNWGRKNQILPNDNIAMKEKILSKIPFSVDSYRVTTKKKPLPWISFAFGAMAVVTLLISVSPIFQPRISSIGMGVTDLSDSGFSINGIERLKIVPPPYLNNENKTSDTREFLKINYHANIQTRNITKMVEEVASSVRIFGGRIDSLNSREKYGNINFSIPADQFEIFKREIKSLTNARLFVDGENSTNLLSQKQNIEAMQMGSEKIITNLKKDRIELNNSYSQINSSYTNRVDGLDAESELLQIEWQNAEYDRRLEINYRITQIQGERNILESELAKEHKNYLSKLNDINKQIKNNEDGLAGIKQQDQNLLENVSMVNGSVSFNWISLWKLVDLFIPGPLLAWIFAFAGIVSYWRYHIYMRVFI
jgi:hypothetical protein